MSKPDEIQNAIEQFEAEIEGLERQRCQKNAPLSHIQWEECYQALRSYFFEDAWEPCRLRLYRANGETA
jgi:hypothetical protein